MDTDKKKLPKIRRMTPAHREAQWRLDSAIVRGEDAVTIQRLLDERDAVLFGEKN